MVIVLPVIEINVEVKSPYGQGTGSASADLPVAIIKPLASARKSDRVPRT